MSSKIEEEKERLDLRGVRCPMNFVKTKLKLEQMGSGQILEVILDEEEAVRDVPKSLKEEGHRVLNLQKVKKAFLLTVKKA